MMTELNNNNNNNINDNNNAVPTSLPSFRGPCFQDPSSHKGQRILWHEKERQSLDDIYDRLACSETFIEAEAEQQGVVHERTLVVETQQKHVVLLHGPIASGKRTLLRGFQRSVEDKGGLFLTVHHSMSWGYQHPHEAMLQGLVNFARTTMQRCNAETLTRIRCASALSPGSGQLDDLRQRIPSLADLLGTKTNQDQEETLPTKNENTGVSTREGMLLGLDGLTPYFRYSFQKLLQILTDPDRPLVFVVENLQWASEATLDVLHAIIRDSSHQGVLVIGVYQDDDSQAQSMVERWKNEGTSVDVHDIEIQRILDEPSLQPFLTRILGPMPSMESLTDIIHENCKGNLLCIDQVLYWLQENGSLSQDAQKKSWTFCDENLSSTSSYDIMKFICSTTSSLTPEIQELFQIFMCIGPKVHTNMVRLLGDIEMFDMIEHKLLQNNLLVQDTSATTVCFAHDFAHHVLYHSIEPEERMHFHYRLGKLLWSKLDFDTIDEELLFSVVDHLRVGRQSIKGSRERLSIAELCLGAAHLSVKQATYSMASKYLEFGMSLLGERRWQNSYELCLKLYSAGAEVALCTTRFDYVDQLAEEVIRNAQAFEDTLQARSAQVYMLGASGKAHEALQYGCSVLSRLGAEVPMHPSKFRALRLVQKTKALLRGLSDEQIRRLPPMTDIWKLTALKILTILFTFCFSVDPLIAPYIAHETIRLTLSFGICSISSMGFVLYGAILCRTSGGVEEGYRYGRLALSIQSDYHVDIWSGRVNAIFYGGVYGFKNPLQGASEELEIAGQRCVLVGDKEFGMRCANVFVTCQIDTLPIPELTKAIRRIRGEMRCYGYEHNLLMMLPAMHMLLKLSGRTDGDFKFLEEARNLEEFCASLDSSSGVARWGYYSLMMVEYMFGNYEQAFAYSKGAKELLGLAMGSGDVTVTFLFDGLTSIALARRSSGLKRMLHIRNTRARIRSLHDFARHAPLNFLGKASLLEAELAALCEDHTSAYYKYTTSIALSKENGLFVGTALAQERAGKYFLERQDNELSSRFLSEAIARYTEYGAEAKARHLREELTSQGKQHLTTGSRVVK